MAEKDDGLGLGLSLRCSENHSNDPRPQPTSSPPFPLNLLRSPLPFIQQQQHKSAPAEALHQFTDGNMEARSSFRGIDVNRPVTVTDCDEEVMVMSPNSTVSSLSGKRSEREENDGERASSSLELEEEDGGDAAARKKLRLSKEQAAVLEETFKEHNTLNPKQKTGLAKQLNLMPRQVEVWFQNRRARTKLKQTEVDCEYLRRCCEEMTEENRRLQKEVSELRALKLSPQLYMNMSPPTTLTMCPQCQRVAVSASSSSPAKPPLQRPPPPINSWASIFPPQSLDAHRPRT